MDQRLIGPGVVEGRGHVDVSVHQDEQRPLKTAQEEKDDQTLRKVAPTSSVIDNYQLMTRQNGPGPGPFWGRQEPSGVFRANWFSRFPTEVRDNWSSSDLNCPDAMLSPVNRLFLASRRFSRSFLSNFCKRKQQLNPPVPHKQLQSDLNRREN